MAAQHPTERGTPGRGLFDHVAQSASHFTSSPSFFVVCVVVVALWLATHVAGLSTEWQHLSGDAMAAITLLLLALLKNLRAARRARRPGQARRDRGAILEQREGKSSDAHAALEDAIGMHEEV